MPPNFESLSLKIKKSEKELHPPSPGPPILNKLANGVLNYPLSKRYISKKYESKITFLKL